MISAQKLKLVHVARRELELPEQSYREILRHHGGVESSKDLDDDGFKRGHELNEGARCGGHTSKTNRATGRSRRSSDRPTCGVIGGAKHAPFQRALRQTK